jgi:hypothetical protein
VFSSKGIKRLPPQERSNYKNNKYANPNKSVQYNTASGNFDWYLISLSWCNATAYSRITPGASCGGGLSGCCNITSSCGGAGVSSCGGGMSSCGGGGASSCGGGSSSCGGGC